MSSDMDRPEDTWDRRLDGSVVLSHCITRRRDSGRFAPRGSRRRRANSGRCRREIDDFRRRQEARRFTELSLDNHRCRGRARTVRQGGGVTAGQTEKGGFTRVAMPARGSSGVRDARRQDGGTSGWELAGAGSPGRPEAGVQPGATDGARPADDRRLQTAGRSCVGTHRQGHRIPPRG